MSSSFARVAAVPFLVLAGLLGLGCAAEPSGEEVASSDEALKRTPKACVVGGDVPKGMEYLRDLEEDWFRDRVTDKVCKACNATTRRQTQPWTVTLASTSRHPRRYWADATGPEGGAFEACVKTALQGQIDLYRDKIEYQGTCQLSFAFGPR